MDRSNLRHRPPLPDLDNNLGNLFDDLLVIGLILEAGHAASTR